MTKSLMQSLQTELGKLQWIRTWGKDVGGGYGTQWENSKNKIPFAGTHKANEIEGGPNKHMEKNVKDRYE